eukprot:3670513-Rhodomonas_salina.2
MAVSFRVSLVRSLIPLFFIAGVSVASTHQQPRALRRASPGFPPARLCDRLRGGGSQLHSFGDSNEAMLVPEKLDTCRKELPSKKRREEVVKLMVQVKSAACQRAS